jgi:hypothetical protein
LVKESTSNKQSLGQVLKKDLLRPTHDSEVLVPRGLDLSAVVLSKDVKWQWQTAKEITDNFVDSEPLHWAPNEDTSSELVVKNSSKPGRVKIALGPTLVGNIDEWIPWLSSYTKGILLIPAFSMQWHNIPFMSKKIFSHFALVVKTIGDTPSGTYSSDSKQSTW